MLKKELMVHLRSKRRIRRSQHSHIFQRLAWSNPRCPLHPGKARGSCRPRYTGSLGGRSSEWLKEQSCGHLGGAPFTLAALVKVSGKDTAMVVAALTQQIRKLPANLRRSLTWDQGLEMPSTRPSRWRQM